MRHSLMAGGRHAYPNLRIRRAFGCNRGAVWLYFHSQFDENSGLM